MLHAYLRYLIRVNMRKVDLLIIMAMYIATLAQF